MNTIKKILKKIKYPKFILLILTFILAYVLFAGRDLEGFRQVISGLGYFSTYLAGIFFAYGFTAAPATAVLLILSKDQNIFIAGFTAGLGALTADLIIFKLIRHSFMDEIKKLSLEEWFIFIKDKIHPTVKKYFLPILAGFMIASPLPDEIGVALIASTQISNRLFYFLSYTLNTAGIFVVLLIGKGL